MVFSHQPGCSISCFKQNILNKKMVIGFALWMQALLKDSYVLLTLFEICCSITKSCLTLWDPMYCSMLGFPILHYLPVFAQTHIRWVCDAIQSSHPLSPPSPPALYLSQHQSFPMSKFFASGDQSIGASASASASVLPMNIQGWFPLELTGLISLNFKGLQVFSFDISLHLSAILLHLTVLWKIMRVSIKNVL